MSIPDWADKELSARLPEMRRRGEGQSLEFKRELEESGDQLRKEIAAFASTNAGVILIGVADDGTLVGLNPTETSNDRSLLLSRVEGRARGVVPPITPEIKFAVEDGKTVMVIGVPRGPQPIYYSNNIPYVRFITQAQPATAQEVIDRVGAWLRNTIDHDQTDDQRAEDFASANEALYGLAVDEHRGGVPAIVTRPRLLLGFAPFATRPGYNLSMPEVAKAQTRFPPNLNTKVYEDCDGIKWWSCAPPRIIGPGLNPETNWLMRLVRPGYLEFQMTIGQRIDDDQEIPVDGRQLEGDIVFNLERMASIMVDLGLGGPALCNIRFQGVEDVLLMRARPPSRKIGRYEIPLSPVLLENPIEPIANFLQQSFDIMWQTAGWKDGSPSFNQGVWSGYSQGTLYGQ